MPISPDGTITPAPSEGRRYTTRYLVEFLYTVRDPLVAAQMHAIVQQVMDTVLDGFEAQVLPEVNLDIRTSSHDAPLPGDQTTVLYGAARQEPPAAPGGGGAEGGSASALVWPREATLDEIVAAEREQFPEAFDADGNYIGPD